MICDEVKPNCVVRACCTDRCWEANNAIENNLRMVKSAHAYAYGNMRKNEYCPVCHSNIFTYKYMSQFSLTLFIKCKYCNTRYELFKYDNGWVISNADTSIINESIKLKEYTLEEIFKHMKNK